jgi:hypothetical protein
LTASLKATGHEDFNHEQNAEIREGF